MRKHRSSRQHAVQEEYSLSALGRRSVDFSLIGLLFVAPLFMGGRNVVGEFVYVGFAGLLAIGCTFWLATTHHHSWRKTRVEWLWVAGICLLALQLFPMSAKWLEKFSPGYSQLLPLWTESRAPWFQFGDWQTLSVTPVATQENLAIFLAYAVIFFAVVQRIRDVHDVHRWLRIVAVSVIGLAILGLTQFLIGNGKFLWVYEHPTRVPPRAVCGPFINENHFGHLLALGLGPLLWWFQSEWNKETFSSKFSAKRQGSSEIEAFLKPALILGLGFVLLAGILTFSRGGFGAIFLVVAIAGYFFSRCSLIETKAVIGGLASCAMVGCSMLIFGHDRVSEELNSITAANSVQELLGARRLLWLALLEGISQFPWFGTGAGSHADACPVFFSAYTHVEFTHAESGYMQLLFETGVIGLTLMLIAIVICFRWCYVAYRSACSVADKACAAAVTASLAVSAIHSVIEFAWYIPACMTMTVILAAIACRLAQISTKSAEVSESKPLPEISQSKNRWLSVCAALAVAFLMISNRWPDAYASGAWDRYYRVSYQQGSNARQNPETVEAMCRDLRETVARNPSHPRAHARLAGLCLHRFEQLQKESENPMSLGQIHEAAVASNFASPQAQWEWVKAAVGEHHSLLLEAQFHARRALQLCPLLGESYIYLAELSFLETNYAGAKHDYVVQALRVRPNSGSILIAAGAEAAFAGDGQRAMRFWKKAFETDFAQRQKIIEMLGLRMPVSEFIEHFQPQEDSLRKMWEFYRTQDRKAELKEVAPHLVAALQKRAEKQTGAVAASSWHEVRLVHEQLGNKLEALECSRKAVERASDELRCHQYLATDLIENGKPDEAIEEIRWCLLRRPDDPTLTHIMANAQRKKSELKAAVLSQPTQSQGRTQ